MTAPYANDDATFIDTTVAHAARVYDYLLDGVTNFEVDRQAAEQQAAAFGGLDKARASVQGNRRFLGRAVHYLAAEAGIRQFLDIGTGIPAKGNVHEVAQLVDPSCRVVYVDHDPVVLAHAHELLRREPGGATAFVFGDFHEHEDVLKQAAETLDFDKPVAVLLIALLHLMPDQARPYETVRQLVEAVPAGSYLVVSHMASDIEREAMAALADAVPASARYRFAMRSRSEVAEFFDGLELVEPGVVPIDQWRPDEAAPEDHGLAHHYGAVGRKS